MKFTVIFLIVIFAYHLNAKNTTNEDIVLVLLRRLLGEIDQMKQTISFQTALIDRKDEVISSLQQKVNNIDKRVATINGSTSTTSSSSPWIPQQYNVCFGAKDDTYGSFRLNQEGALYALKLVHRTGSVRCVTSPVVSTKWGCDGGSYYNKTMVGVVVTDDNRGIVFPKNVEYIHGFYRLPGYHSNKHSVAFVDFTTPMYAEEGQELQLWYGEDWENFAELDNGGTTCADVYAKFA